MSLTPAQNDAVITGGNVVVVAGAGTGKTSTLVARCLHCLVHSKPPASLDEILIVTFTEAAAAEIRERIRTRLEEELKLHPDQPRWQEELALFETAHIGTLHSFCFQLVRQHFYELELDPQLSVISEEEARLLAEETLSAILEKHYAGKTDIAPQVQELIQAQGGGSDKQIRQLVLRIHNYTQTLPDPKGWYARQLELFARPDAALWQEWLSQALRSWRERWLPQLLAGSQRRFAGESAKILSALDPNPQRAQAIDALRKIAAAEDQLLESRNSVRRTPLDKFLKETDFLAAVSIPVITKDGPQDPLEQDWRWVRGQMLTLLRVARDFTETFSDTKRELGSVDFHDLEQHALRLLRNPETGEPTPIAREWQDRLRFVFVDEYQDINAAQDGIIAALSRAGSRANRFLVGDVKQSIYRFRLANPHIFQHYVELWSRKPGPAEGSAVQLVENFRSREAVLSFVNSVFSVVMRRELGGVEYDDSARLRFGAPQERKPLSLAANAAPAVELHLRFNSIPGRPAPSNDADAVILVLQEMAEAEKEARTVALSLLRLKERAFQVWDDERKAMRLAEWGDMAVLLRAPSGKSESYAKEFVRYNIPLQVERSAFYQAMEVNDLLSLLRILDNPLQNLPLLAVLHSPLVGLTANELATIRLAGRGTFWATLVRWARSRQPADNADTLRKVSGFLDRFYAWRRVARQGSLSRCLDAILSQTHYATWVRTQPRGEQRFVNVQRLLALAQQFDRFRRQGLFRFLSFVDAQQMAETEPAVAAVNAENSVRLMSIHQSKGLEFPIVALADLGKRFNFSDLYGEIILDEQFGLCPQIKPPKSGRRYPSLAHWLAGRHQRSELLGEEIRLLYVAMTRAKDRLILSANLTASQFQRRWRGVSPDPFTLSTALSYSDWLGAWFSAKVDMDPQLQPEGENALLQWKIEEDSALATAAPGAEEKVQPDSATDSATWQKLNQQLTWTYPFAEATQTPAKASVTALRRRANESEEEEMARRWRPRQGKEFAEERANVGIAHHRFLEWASLDRVENIAELHSEAKRLVEEKKLSPEEAAVLDFEGLAAFWQSEPGKLVRSQAAFARRELVFTARFSPAELADLTGDDASIELADEFVVVQGVVDLAVILTGEIWLVDFKTDQAKGEDLERKVEGYRRQLELYALALTRVYQRPVRRCWLYFLSARQAVPLPVGVN